MTDYHVFFAKLHLTHPPSSLRQVLDESGYGASPTSQMFRLKALRSAFCVIWSNNSEWNGSPAQRYRIRRLQHGRRLFAQHIAGRSRQLSRLVPGFAGITESLFAALNYVQLAQGHRAAGRDGEKQLVWAKERVAAQSAKQFRHRPLRNKLRQSHVLDHRCRCCYHYPTCASGT